MEPEYWRRIEELFHATLQMEVGERAAYLARACAGDEALRLEVESLVRVFESEQSFMEQPTISLGLRVLLDDKPGMLAGCTVGEYKILRLLGRGGMGEVYVAQDCKLERHVALKFLADKHTSDEWARRRLTKEARTVAMLEHPNICAVYGFEEIDGYRFMVMQYIEGETLASLLGEGPLAPAQALHFAEQIASALSAAHAHDIIHRDIKPQNIVITTDGQVKVLDFGLAKVVRHAEFAASMGDSLVSQQGLILGTIAYMSPEQLRAEKLDFRSDIFSFGIVLHEMLSGTNPFRHDNEADTISAILSHTPRPLKEAAPGVPEGLNHITRKCLEKEPKRRYQTADDLLCDLRAMQEACERGQSSLRSRLAPLLQLRSAGFYQLAAVALLLLLLATTALFNFSRRSGAPTVQTLVILPLKNESADPELDYLSEGLTESLTDKLSQVSSLRVKAVTAASFDKNQAMAPMQAGRALNADAVLVGQIIKQESAFQLHLSVVRTADGATLWDETFNLNTSNVVGLQAEIPRKMVAGMHLLVSGQEQLMLRQLPTGDPNALRLCMLGRYYWNLRDRVNIQKAIDYFDQAIRLDPLYAKAYAGLADSYVLLNLTAYGSLSTKEAMIRARAAAKEALKYDDTLAEAHTSLGVVKLKYEWNWQEAEREFQEAIKLDAEYVPAHYSYSNLLVVTKRFDEAIRESELAREIDPFSPTVTMNLGRTYYFARQYDKTTAYFNEILKRDANDIRATYMLGLVYLQTKRYDEAISLFEKLHTTEPIFAAAPLGFAYGKTGRPADALKIIDELDRLAQDNPVPPLEKAIIYIGMNDRDKAFEFLQQSYDERFSSLIGLTTEPLFDDLRADPRFAELAMRMNLPL